MKSWHLIYLTVIFSASIISCAPAPVPNPTPPGVETGGATDGGSSTPTPGAKIIAHEHASLDLIPSSAIAQAKASVSIYYGHTSHGSQLMSGMDGLDAFKGGTGLYEYNTSGSGGALAVVEGGNDAGYYPA